MKVVILVYLRRKVWILVLRNIYVLKEGLKVFKMMLCK